MTELVDIVALRQHENYHDRMMSVYEIAAMTGTKKLNKLSQIAGVSPLKSGDTQRSPSDVSSSVMALRQAHNDKVAGVA